MLLVLPHAKQEIVQPAVVMELPALPVKMDSSNQINMVEFASHAKPYARLAD